MEIDWSVPWLAPYRQRGQDLSAALACGASVAEALNEQGVLIPLAAGPLRFVAQAALPAGEAYENFISRSACVPTRDTAHDLFNGLIWLHWPALKTRLNRLHVQALAEAGAAATRGSLRDALTLLDENAALLQAPPALCEALRARDWQRLFVDLRPLWAEARLQLVGHALLEKLLQPRKPICAHVLLLPFQSEAEALLTDPGWLASKPFLPLPVLGVPGWWAANEDAAFYADRRVFRPAAHRQTG